MKNKMSSRLNRPAGKLGASRTQLAAAPNRANTQANWQRRLDQYLILARDWVAKGDTIEAENCYQHAEHCFRMIRSTST